MTLSTRKKDLSSCNFLEGRGKKDVVEQSEDSCSFMIHRAGYV